MSSYRLVSLAYPASYRRDHLTEIVETANELAGSDWSFRQSRSLLTNGLRTRGKVAVGSNPKQAWVAGVRGALIIRLLESAAFFIVVGLDPAGSGLSRVPGSASPWLAVGPLLCLGFLLRSTRWPTAAVVSAVSITQAAVTLRQFGEGPVWGAAIAFYTLAPIPVAWWATRYRSRPIRFRRLAIPLIAIVALGSLTGPGAMMATLSVSAFLLLPALGLLLLMVDPRPMTAAAVLSLMALPVFVTGPIPESPQGPFPWAAIGLLLAIVGAITGLAWFGSRRLALAAT